MLSISSEVLHNELAMAVAILKKWQERSEQIPGVHTPVAPGALPEAQERWFQELVGELQIVSAKCDALVEVLARS